VSKLLYLETPRDFSHDATLHVRDVDLISVPEFDMAGSKEILAGHAELKRFSHPPAQPCIQRV
jgi:hypothetical protein